MRVRALIAATTAVALLAGVAQGQTFNLPVTSTWQISTNNGATWNSGETQVPLSTSSVRVRMVVSWTPPVVDPNAYLIGTTFDGYVRGLNGAGTADTVSAISLLSLGIYQSAPAGLDIAGRRVGADLIKIDRGDALPLGQGTVISVGNAPAFGSVVFGTPVTVFDYLLNLDGSAGSREVGLVYAAVPSPVRVSTLLPGGFTTISTQALTQPATLVVVPSPAGLAVLGVASSVLMRRRRS
jgi:hypothetical protein